MFKQLLSSHLFILLLAGSASALDEKLSGTLRDIHGGLVIHLGATDGKLESEIASAEGKFLVHALAAVDQKRNAARASILQSNLYGLASVTT